MEQMIDRNVIDFEKWKKRKDTKKIKEVEMENNNLSNDLASGQKDNHIWLMSMIWIVCIIMAIVK